MTEICLMCGTNQAADEDGFCSPCGFTVQHIQTLGFALVPTNLAGVGCETCLKADVCVLKREADVIGALIGACAARAASSEQSERHTSPVQDDDAIMRQRALAKCKLECPHSGDRGELDGCKFQSFDQRLSFCHTIAQWVRTIDC